MTKKVIAILNTKGGPGKTAFVLALATWWSEPLTIVDIDPRPSLTATSWLDKADRAGDAPDNLEWIKAAAQDLSPALTRMNGTIIIDSAGQVPTNETLQVAELADLIIVPGASNELEAIGETVSTLRDGLNASPPIGIVLTKANPTAIKGRIGPATALIESSLDVEVLGWMPLYADIADAPQNGQMLNQIGHNAQAKLEKQTTQIIRRVKEIINA